jgi:hypothetical protein
MGRPAVLVPALTGRRGAGAAGLLGATGASRDHHRLGSPSSVPAAAPRMSSARVGVARRGRSIVMFCGVSGWIGWAPVPNGSKAGRGFGASRGKGVGDSGPGVNPTGGGDVGRAGGPDAGRPSAGGAEAGRGS